MDDLLAEFGGSEILGTLGITKDAIVSAQKRFGSSRDSRSLTSCSAGMIGVKRHRATGGDCAERAADEGRADQKSPNRGGGKVVH